MNTVATEPVQLLVYRFDDAAGLEGQFVGALERLEAGGALRVLDVLVVASEPVTGEVIATRPRDGSMWGLAGSLVAFRLDEAARTRATRRALARDGEITRALGATLRRGEALAAVLIAHTWAGTLEDAVRRTGGTGLENAMVGRRALTELSEMVLAAARRRP
jgi:hypothetical protein